MTWGNSWADGQYHPCSPPRKALPMSALDELLGGALGGDMMAKIATELNTDEAGAQKAVGAALPALLSKLKANADDPVKAEQLATAVNRDHDGAILDSAGDRVGGLLGGADQTGSKIIGHVFGDEADAVHEQVAAAAGIDKGKAAGLLATLAPLVLGALGKFGQASGGVQAQGLSGMLGGLLSGGGGLGDMLGGLQGGGGGLGSMLGGGGAGSAGGADGAGGSSPLGKVTSMLDQNKDGSVIDDLTRMATGGGSARGSGTSGASGLLSKLMGMLRRK